jgi:cyclophilin family peptidyl-prolyl cis-trans isomerase
MTALFFTACNNVSDNINQTQTPTTPHVAPKYEDIDRSSLVGLNGVTTTDEQTDYVLLDIENYGQILIRLYPDVAPETVANFKKLVSEGFYDGLTFHRVIEGFMIQGGDPAGNGTGGSDTPIKGEFTSNGFENNLKHTRGVVSMARTNNPDSASSQFFICHKTSGVAPLDGKYATFGYVVYGMSVVDKIAAVNTDANDKPKTSVVITSAKFANVTNVQVVPERVAPKYEEIDRTPVDSIDGINTTQTQTDYVIIDVAEHGKMLVRLYPDVAPKTVANFKKLVSEGFYDGLTFHRIVEGFMIQGGDPDGDGYGGSGTPIVGEFTANDFENNLRHTRGVLSMARTNYPDSATSQFFICHKDEGVAHLNGKYAAFGYVVYGLEVIDSIAAVETNANDRPKTSVIITSIKFAELYDGETTK